MAGGLNLYGFAGGDPINFSDPFGLKPCEEMGFQDHWDYDLIEGVGRDPQLKARRHNCSAERKAAFKASQRQFHAWVGAAQCSAGVMSAAGGAGAGLTEHTSIRPGQWRSPNTGRWYSTLFKGGSPAGAGSRNAVLQAGEAAKAAGKAFGYLSVGVGFAFGTYYLVEGNYEASLLSLGDAAAGFVSTLGPGGLTLGLGWFAVRHFSGCGR